MSRLNVIRSAIAFFFATTFLLQGCEVSSEEKEAIDEKFLIDQEPSAVSAPPIAPSCFGERFLQPPAEISRKIDILFLTDTSGSLDEERAGIADGIDAFIAALPAEVDYSIGVMFAHGSKSSQTGKLWRKYANEPYVLGSASLSQAQIRNYLKTKLTKVVTDNYSDGGEIGSYALKRALDSDRLEVSRSQGFFREDAALAVVLISDENDICAKFPAGVKPVKDPEGKEKSSFLSDCPGVDYAEIVGRMKQVQGDRPFSISAIAYNDPHTYPRSNENEYGYGWIDLARLGNGIVVDLANPHYQEGLASIGAMATVKLNLKSEFTLSPSEITIEPSSVQAFVDGVPAPSTFFPETQTVRLTDELGGANSAIDVQYCQKTAPMKVSELCREGEFEPKAVLKVGMSIDPSDGSFNTITSGMNEIGVGPVLYSHSQIADGLPVRDGVSVLVLSRVATQRALPAEYVAGLRSYIASGGSLIAEFDAAALFFDRAEGPQPIIQKLSTAFSLFSGIVSGGGTLLPLESSRTYVTDPYDPIMFGIPSNFLQGPKTAFAVTDFDGEWLHASATFTSTGYQDMVPEGTYPAVLSGRCGKGRIVLITMSHFQTVRTDPVRRMLMNMLNWVTGR